MATNSIPVSALLAAIEQAEAQTFMVANAVTRSPGGDNAAQGPDDSSGLRAALTEMSVSELSPERLLQLTALLLAGFQRLEALGLNSLKKIDPNSTQSLFGANGLLPRTRQDELGVAVRAFLEVGDETSFAKRLRSSTGPLEWISTHYWTYPTPMTVMLLSLVFRLRREAKQARLWTGSGWPACLRMIDDELQSFESNTQAAYHEWFSFGNAQEVELEELQQNIDSRILLKVARALNLKFNWPMKKESKS